MIRSIWVYTLGVCALTGLWWKGFTPPEHLQVGDPIVFSDSTSQTIDSTDQSTSFASSLESLPSELPGHDDVVFLHGGQKVIASGMDGRLWEYNFVEQKAKPFIDPPLMAAGLHESIKNSDDVYFCASHLWGDSYPKDERVGLYRLQLSTQKIEAVVLEVPATQIISPKVWADSDPDAPRLAPGVKDWKSRPLAFCNDLEISEDGQRIYFTEPFSYKGASMGGGTISEVIAYNGNGRVWRHDLNSGETRLIAEGFHFVDGILYDLHPGQTREQSIISSQTTGFRIIRFYLNGPKAGSSELVLDGLPGMCDGMDRDAKGRIWCAMYTQRSAALTWLHENPWLKPLLLRLPLNWIAQPKITGVLALEPDASAPLYSAWYEGPIATHVASAIPGPDNQIYLTPFSKIHRGLVRIKNPIY